MEEALLGIVTTINNYLSNYILIILLLGMGIWFTVRTKAIQFRCFGEGWRRVFGDFSLRGGNQGGGMTSFQALSTAIAAQVGTGNIVGASGVAGISAVTGAKPDGYTLGVTPSAPLAMHPHMRKVPYTLDSFDFVGRILKAPYIVMVAKTAPWNTLDDMLRDMKATPNTFFFASSGVGSVPYFAMMDLFKKAGAQVRHVPFSGDADAFQAIAGNRVQVYTSTAGSLDQYDVKGLALMDATRDPLLPNLPTVKESGVEAYYSQWMPLLAPKGLPADIKATLSDAMRKAMQSPEFVERLHKLNLVPGYLDSKDCRTFVEEESVRNAEVIKGLMAK